MVTKTQIILTSIKKSVLLLLMIKLLLSCTMLIGSRNPFCLGPKKLFQKYDASVSCSYVCPQVFQKGSLMSIRLSTEIAQLCEDGTLKALGDKWLKRQSSMMSKDFSAHPQAILNLFGLRGLLHISGVSKVLALLVSVVYLLTEKCHLSLF